MPDKVIDIPGLGPIAFPDSMSDADINAAAAKLYQQANPSHPPPDPAHSWVKTAADWIPAVGGAVGGFVGGIPGAAVGGGAGEGYKQLLTQAGEIPGALVDVARGLVNAPRETLSGFMTGAGEGAVSAGIEAGKQAAAQTAGTVIGAGMRAAAPRVMQAAVKPTIKMLAGVMKGEAVPRVVQTLLDEGVNVTPGGYQRLQELLTASSQKLKGLLGTAEAAGAPGVSPYAVTRRLGEVAARVGQQVNPVADVATVSRVGNEFLAEHGGRLIPLTEANALKEGTYQTLRKSYGQLGSADIEAQKALARGLKEEIEQQAPGVEAVNRQIGNYTEAAKAVGRRVAVAANRDPVGFAWVAHNPQMFLAALLDRSPAVKSMLARGLYQSAGRVAQVSPQLIRAAVVALTTDPPGAGPAPE